MMSEEKINVLKELGQEIRIKREELGLSFDDIYQRSRIQPSYLDALENANYEALPSAVYTLGFLRTYLGILEFNELYPEFRHWLLRSTRSQGKNEGEMLGPYASPSPGFKLASRFWVFAVLLLIIFGAMTYVAYSWRDGIPNLVRLNEQRSENPGQHSETVSADASGDIKSADISADVSIDIPIPKPEPLKPELKIIAAYDDCWISVRVGNGRIEDRMLKKGETYTMELTERTRVNYGRPWAVTVIHNGKDIGTPYKSGTKRPQVNFYDTDGKSAKIEPRQP